MKPEEKEALRTWAKDWSAGIGHVQARQVLELLAELEAEVAFRVGCQQSAVEMNNVHVAEIRHLRKLNESLAERVAAQRELLGKRAERGDV